MVVLAGHLTTTVAPGDHILLYRSLLPQMMTEDLDQILILEDDVVFEPYFRYDLARVLEEANRITPNWDLM